MLRAASPFMKNESGVWEATFGPLPAGAFRYSFQMDGMRVLDPVNPKISEDNANAWSLVVVSGSDFMDTKDVRHGAVAAVYYYSAVLKTTHRMHIYTPPRYETSSQRYPVFYLLHGSGGSDDSWWTAGRAGFILDNLIAAKKAKPMIVVMTAGHQPATAGWGTTPAAADPSAVNPFTRNM